ncbi:MAG TPA: DUF1302 family protein [Burkholderiaceae bacterium]|nr:DUF1302 family protein [Burkholderiaceae bacterium]HEX4598322.1 DUF1302 family protein [Burkholderiaceae bacterium]
MSKEVNLCSKLPADRRFVGALVFGVLCWTTVAQAAKIDTGNPDFALRWDNEVQLTAGFRVEGRNPAIANSPVFDEGDYKFDSGHVVTERFSLLSEMDLVYKEDYGLRLSGSGWYDPAYNSNVKQNPAFAALGTSYPNNTYTSYTKKYYEGPSGELLDAFVFGKLDFGLVPVYGKLGQHTIYWGESLFSLNGVAYSQEPIDGLKAALNPGAEVKELFLPLDQLSLKSQVSSSVSLAAQYFFDWEPFRISQGGTYFGGTNFILQGPTRFPAFHLVHAPDVEPDRKSGNWGVQAKWAPENLRGTSFGLVFRRFDEKLFWLLLDPKTFGYHAVYPRGTELLGLTSTFNVGESNLGAEVVYRRNTGLATQPFAVSDTGTRGDTTHVIVNYIKLLPKTAVFETGTVVAEVALSHLNSIKENAGLYNGCDQTHTSAGQGCATRNATSFSLLFSPQYLQVFPSVDLTVPMFFTMGLSGGEPTITSGDARAYNYSIGTQFDYRQKYTMTLQYAASYARPGAATYATTDRGWLSLNFKATF